MKLNEIVSKTGKVCSDFSLSLLKSPYFLARDVVHTVRHPVDTFKHNVTKYIHPVQTFKKNKKSTALDWTRDALLISLFSLVAVGPSMNLKNLKNFFEPGLKPQVTEAYRNYVLGKYFTQEAKEKASNIPLKLVEGNNIFRGRAMRRNSKFFKYNMITNHGAGDLTVLHEYIHQLTGSMIDASAFRSAYNRMSVDPKNSTLISYIERSSVRDDPFRVRDIERIAEVAQLLSVEPSLFPDYMKKVYESVLNFSSQKEKTSQDKLEDVVAKLKFDGYKSSFQPLWQHHYMFDDEMFDFSIEDGATPDDLIIKYYRKMRVIESLMTFDDVFVLDPGEEHYKTAIDFILDSDSVTERTHYTNFVRRINNDNSQNHKSPYQSPLYGEVIPNP